MKWINVNDNLPKDHKPKLVRYTSSQRGGVYYGISERFYAENVEKEYWDLEFGNTQGIRITHYINIEQIKEI